MFLQDFSPRATFQQTRFLAGILLVLTTLTPTVFHATSVQRALSLKNHCQLRVWAVGCG